MLNCDQFDKNVFSKINLESGGCEIVPTTRHTRRLYVPFVSVKK